MNRQERSRPPNDLLNVFERGILDPELARAKVKDPEGKVMVRTGVAWKSGHSKGYVRCTHFHSF